MPEATEPGGMSSVGQHESGEAVEAFFGDLVDEVALSAPVTRDRLIAGLAAVDHAIDPDAGTHTESEPTPVWTLPVEEWDRVANHVGLRPGLALAVREVHRRMATAVGASEACSTSGADPFVVMDT